MSFLKFVLEKHSLISINDLCIGKYRMMPSHSRPSFLLALFLILGRVWIRLVQEYCDSGMRQGQCHILPQGILPSIFIPSYSIHSKKFLKNQLT